MLFRNACLGIAVVLLTLSMIGCDIESDADGDVDLSSESPQSASAGGTDEGDSTEQGAETESQSQVGESLASMSLGPANAKIEFIGTHTGDDPKPRHCGIAQFEGMIETDGGHSTPKSFELNFEMESIWTEFDKLTTHLKSNDFFSVLDYPKASFVSKSIEATDEEGVYQVVGDLELLGKKSEVSFTANYEVKEMKPHLHADFMIDRTLWGMEYGLDNIEKNVQVILVIGEKTEPKASN